MVVACEESRLAAALTVKPTLYTLNTQSLIRPFCSKTSHFRDTKPSKIGNAPNDPKLKLEHLTVKSSLHTLRTFEAQILVRFTLRPAGFKIQGCQNSEMYRMTPNWT